ncbi:MAG: CehA/McbA family metallohydrolase [Cyclobacteriaceae bacterium]
MKIQHPLCILLLLIFSSCTDKPGSSTSDPLMLVAHVEPQPLLAQATRLNDALNHIGSPLPLDVSNELVLLQEKVPDATTVQSIQTLLDPFCLAMIHINPESRVKVTAGPAQPQLKQEGWSVFLVKVHNEAAVTARLEVESPQALPTLHKSTGSHRTREEHTLTEAEVENRFLEMAIFRDRPLKSKLSGLNLEYAVMMVYTRETGKKEVNIGFNVGQGTQDIGFRNTIDILFDIQPAVKVVFDIKDENGEDVMASLLISDGIGRFYESEKEDPSPEDYRLKLAQHLKWGGTAVKSISEWAVNMYTQPKLEGSKEIVQPKLSGIYPLPARRVAARDEYPDFFFQPQIYRTSGEHVYLPPGNYNVVVGRGPEYFPTLHSLTVPENEETTEFSVKLNRWIHMKEMGWYSGDHHIHASGCSHYESPVEGVLPEHMWRQVLGEDLNMGSNLTWGPSWYHQKQYFTGESHPLSDEENLLRYDVEVSGFPSSHSGHVVLLNLKEDDYPNTTLIEEWPSWTLPVLQWAKGQGGIVGYAHSGWGLEPMNPTDKLPNYEIPKMTGIGANEYVVTITHDAVDFYSAGDTPSTWELNMWYHSLNAGYRVRLSGETDFPCISDERVGATRTYAKIDGVLNFENYMDALTKGKTYVSDGFSHLIDFEVNGQELGENDSELSVKSGSTLKISGKAVGYLSESQGPVEASLADRPLTTFPYWHVERSRVGKSRKVAVELIVNGEPVDDQEVTADGDWSDINFDYKINQSAWVALRIFPSSHTNPIFVKVDDQPIAVRKSLEWCLASVDQCWKEKSKQIREEEMEDAKKAYDAAKKVYRGKLAKLN